MPCLEGISWRTRQKGYIFIIILLVVFPLNFCFPLSALQGSISIRISFVILANYFSLLSSLLFLSFLFCFYSHVFVQSSFFFNSQIVWTSASSFSSLWVWGHLSKSFLTGAYFVMSVCSNYFLFFRFIYVSAKNISVVFSCFSSICFLPLCASICRDILNHK